MAIPRSTSLLTCSGWLCLMLAGTCGCDPQPPEFAANRLFAKRLETTQAVDLDPAVVDVQRVLREWFGTPDHPTWPAFLENGETRTLLQAARLERAAGQVRSDEAGRHWGLYREHCVVCHGLAGDGLGPSAALVNPYPRDFRLGKFKFKSTPIGVRPTREDLLTTLRRGIVGTSMPAFDLLADEDLQTLVDYVVYLSIRGEIERRLLLLASELDYEQGERLVPRDATAGIDQSPHGAEVQAIAQSVVQRWHAAGELSVHPIQPPDGFPLLGRASPAEVEVSIARGRELFRGNLAGCAFCHGVEATGDGQQNNYDDWTRDWTAAAGLNPRDLDELKPMLELGALKPRNILPRNLTHGIFRGGGSPGELYLRIIHGIEGTPMPAVPMLPDNPQGLSEEQVWDLVNYLLSLRPRDSAGGDAQQTAGVTIDG